MKKNKFGMLVLIGLATATLMSSCKKDEDDPTPGTTYGQIDEYDASLKGRDNPTNDAGLSFLKASGNVTMNVATASANQGNVDMIFYYGSGSGNNYTIASATDVVFTNPAATNPFEQILNWTTRNATKFKKLSGVTHAQIDNATNDSLILAHATDLTATGVIQLAGDDAVAFQTAGGKKGIYVVESTAGTTGADRAINIHYIIQK